MSRNGKNSLPFLPPSGGIILRGGAMDETEGRDQAREPVIVDEDTWA